MKCEFPPSAVGGEHVGVGVAEIRGEGCRVGQGRLVV